MYKLLVLDIDGTLINRRKEITIGVKDAVFQAKEKGLQILLCTGRPYDTMKNYLEDLNLRHGLCITNTGAYVQQVEDGKIICDNGLKKKDFIAFYDILKDEPASLAIYSNTNLYCIDVPPNPWAQHDADSLLKPLLPITLSEPWDFPIGRFNIMGEASEVDRAVKKLPPKLLGRYNTVRNETFSFEILNAKAGKENALKQALEYLKIPREEVIAIGDGDNDKKMLAYVGLSIAMGNAPEDVKKAADQITLSNEEDGVAHAIYRWVL